MARSSLDSILWTMSVFESIVWTMSFFESIVWTMSIFESIFEFDFGFDFEICNGVKILCVLLKDLVGKEK